MLFGDEHVKRYEETDGAEGHEWEGTTTLILTTTGRKSGQQRRHPLIYQDTARTTWRWRPRAAPMSPRPGTSIWSRTRRCRSR